MSQILDLVGRISAVAYKSGYGDLETQYRILYGLMGEKAKRVLKPLEKMAQRNVSERGEPGSFVLFDDVPLAAAVKVACLTLAPEGSATGAPLDGFAEALLMLNDLVEETPVTPSDADLSTPEGMRRWIYYLFVVGLCYEHHPELNELARTFDLFLTHRPELRSRSAYIDLPSLIGRSIGLEPDVLWAILFAFLAHFMTITAENAHHTSAAISRTSYFPTTYDFTSDEVDKFFAIVARDASALCDEMRRLYSTTNIRPFHVLPLATTPLVTIQDVAVCPLLRQLIGKMTGGLYHLLLNAIPDPAERDQYQVFVGDVFEDYVHRLLTRVYTAEDGAIPRYIGASTLRAAVPGQKSATPKICDGLIVYRNAVILIETKAKLFAAAARAGDDIKSFFDRLDEMFLRSARQIDATVQHVVGGQLASLGVQPKRIKAFYPVIVLLQGFPMRPPIYQWLERRIEGEGLLQQKSVRPFQCVDAAELEMLEVGLHQGADLRVLLEKKLSDNWGRGESFTNYLYVRKNATFEGRNPYLAGIFKQCTARATEYLRSRAKTDSC